MKIVRRELNNAGTEYGDWTPIPEMHALDILMGWYANRHLVRAALEAGEILSTGFARYRKAGGVRVLRTNGKLVGNRRTRG